MRDPSNEVCQKTDLSKPGWGCSVRLFIALWLYKLQLQDLSLHSFLKRNKNTIDFGFRLFVTHEENTVLYFAE